VGAMKKWRDSKTFKNFGRKKKIRIGKTNDGEKDTAGKREIKKVGGFIFVTPNCTKDLPDERTVWVSKRGGQKGQLNYGYHTRR